MLAVNDVSAFEGDSGTTTPATTTTLVDSTTSTIALNTTTTAPPLQKTGTKVQVANASGVSGLARQAAAFAR